VITFGETEGIGFHVSTGEPSWIRTSDLLIKSLASRNRVHRPAPYLSELAEFNVAVWCSLGL